MPGEREDMRVTELCKQVEDLEQRRRKNDERRGKVREALEESRALAGVSIPYRELDHLSFLAVRIGRVVPSELPALQESLASRAIVLPVDGEGGIVAVAAKKGRYALDTELERAKFKAKDLPVDFSGVPSELPAALERELDELEREGSRLTQQKSDMATALEAEVDSLYASYTVSQSVDEIKSGLENSESVYRIEGWVPRDSLKPLIEELERTTEGRVAIRSYTPEELPSVRSGAESVPVLLKRRLFISSFEGIVLSYGAPLYGSIDPTPLVAFFFILLFSIMFGDLGQGLVILLAGLALKSGKFKKLKGFGKFGPICIAVGIGSMFMGFLNGSFFTDEELLVPLNRSLSGFLFGTPIDRFITIMPKDGMGKLFAFFGFTIGVGVIMNSVGLVVNIIDKFKHRKIGEALFSKTGIAGAAFFWWAIGIGVRVLLGGSVAWFDAIGLGLPILVLFFGESFAELVEGHRAGHEAREAGEGEAEGTHKRQGFLSIFIKGLVEVIDSVSYYFSNTLSFLRVGAFALSHAVLSFIVFTLADLLKERLPAGQLWMLLVLIVGNAIILVLEGMIVTIQVIRLQYYEFFSKFFTETGKLFDPFRFQYRKRSES